MGLLSIFQRNKQTAAKPAKQGRAGKAGSRAAAQANAQNPADAAEAVRDARARARRRLMGATVLLLVGVIGFPLLFETQPRPIPVDLPIEIPSRNAGGVDVIAPAAHPNRVVPNNAPLAPDNGMPVMAASAGAPESVSYDTRASAPVAATSAPAAGGRAAFAALAAAFKPASAGASAGEAKPARTSEAPAVGAAPVASTVAHSEPRSVAAAVASSTAPAPAHVPSAPAKPVAHANVDSAPAVNVAEAAPHPAEAGTANRFVVQIGAFADDVKLHEVRAKVEKIGLKTYTQAVDTPGGKRVRVRVGPYATKAEADKVAGRIKSDGLPAAVLAL